MKFFRNAIKNKRTTRFGLMELAFIIVAWLMVYFDKASVTEAMAGAVTAIGIMNGMKRIGDEDKSGPVRE